MPVFKNRQNECIQSTDGREFWISRANAVCVMVVRVNPENTSKLQVLAGLRGKDVTDSGLWCMPCGYLDWDESLKEAGRREVWEESNLLLDLANFEIHEIDSNPSKARQNVTTHFRYFATEDETKDQDMTPKNFGEVEEIRWVTVGEHKELPWAFDHGDRISNLILNDDG